MNPANSPDPVDEDVAVKPDPDTQAHGEGMKPLPFDESNQPKHDD